MLSAGGKRKNICGIAVLVSGGGTNLQALIDAEQSGVLRSGRITAVISDRPGAYALERAKEAGIPGYTVERPRGGDRTAFEAKISEIVDASGADLIILAGFLSILGADFTSKYSRRIINVHPSLIPSFCGDGFYGLKVHEAALARGVKLTGATVHFVNEITDGGEIIAQRAVEVKPGDTPESLQLRVMREAEWVILPQSAEKVCREILEKNRT
ncbi:MAG: phosphoribosylglycinamide formyltransferase [Clostridia bacterium]|nr:phosphoribosylglycinamide formyltransferase [Clostridia bacterium]